MTFRRLVPRDLSAIGALEAEAYLPSLHVSEAAFLRLIELCPDGAVGCFDEDGLCGYAFGVPLTSGSTLDLRVPLPAIPDAPDIFYIHDVAVSERCRRQGIGRQLAVQMLDLARDQGFTRIELVSVQGSAAFWRTLGFVDGHAFEYAPGAPSLHMTREKP